MKYWIIPGNIKIFRVEDYFRDNDIVDWKQSHYKFEIGDVVFIYVSSPIRKIKYKLEVIKTDILYEDSINDSEYWTHHHPMEKDVKHYKYVRLKLKKRSDSNSLSQIKLSDFGFRAPQGPMHKISKELVEYILANFD